MPACCLSSHNSYQQQCVEVIFRNTTIFRFLRLIAKLIPLTLDITFPFPLSRLKPSQSSRSLENFQYSEPFYRRFSMWIGVWKNTYFLRGLRYVSSTPLHTLTRFLIEFLFSFFDLFIGRARKCLIHFQKVWSLMRTDGWVGWFRCKCALCGKLSLLRLSSNRFWRK